MYPNKKTLFQKKSKILHLILNSSLIRKISKTYTRSAARAKAQMSANPTKINARFVAFAIVSVFSFSSASLVVSGKDAHGIVAISASNTQTAFPSKERSLELPREEEEEELAEIPLEEEDSNNADEDIVILSVGDDANDDWLNEEEDEGFDWEDVDTVETLTLYDMGRTNEGDIGQDEEEDEDEESFESLFENEYDGDEFEPTYWQLSRGVIIDDGEFGDDDDDDEEDFEDPCDSPTVNYLRGRIADEYEMWASRPTFSYSETIILPSPALMNSFDNTKSEIELIVHKEITKMLYLALTLFVFCMLLVDTFCGGVFGDDREENQQQQQRRPPPPQNHYFQPPSASSSDFYFDTEYKTFREFPKSASTQTMSSSSSEKCFVV